MFDKEKWMEIFQSIRKHKLRTFLTGFGVAWGIFMLIVLLCVGKGLNNGVSKQFDGVDGQSVQFFAGVTSLPYKGLPTDRFMHYSSADLSEMRNFIPEIRYISPEAELENPGMITYNKHQGTYTVEGVYSEFNQIKYQKISEGRWLNPIDEQQCRKVAVIGLKCKKQLFKDRNPIGESITIKGNQFLVVGVITPDTTKIFNFGGEAAIFVPYASFRKTLQPSDLIYHFDVSASPSASATEVEWKVKKHLARKYIYDINDPRVIWISNNEQERKATGSLFTGLNIFLWFIGISTLVGGIVGVGNIMMVTVKERTKEIGIRKALGAMPQSITSLVIQESIVITTFSGSIGLVLASGVLEVVSYFTKTVSYFQHPEIDMHIALSALIILVVAGALAGYIPARNASKVSPIEALRYE